MRVADRVGCQGWPCADVDHGFFSVLAIAVDPATISVVLTSEVAAPRARGRLLRGTGLTAHERQAVGILQSVGPWACRLIAACLSATAATLPPRSSPSLGR